MIQRKCSFYSKTSIVLIFVLIGFGLVSAQNGEWYGLEQSVLFNTDLKREHDKTFADSVHASQNVRLIAQVNDYPQTGYSDCWGYVAPDGEEYALLGVNNGISIISVSDTNNIHEVDFVLYQESSLGWYDIKTYKNYMYVSTEGSREVLVMDLSGLPGEVAFVREITGMSSNPHNIFIDTTQALLYVVEDFNWNPSVRIFSLGDPENPTQVSTINPNINGMDAHDIFARDSMLYIAEGLDESIGIYDVSDPSKPVLRSRLPIPNAGYVHQVWVSDDNAYMVTTEETNGKSVKVWDIRNMDNIELVDEYLGESDLAHNAFFKNDMIYIAHYESGLKVLDFSSADQANEIGFFDTYPEGEGPEFYGAWGVYPFSLNGLIFVSDMQSGLYVLKFEQAKGPQVVVNNINFGNTLVGTSSDSMPMVIKNFGTEELSITAVSDPGTPFTLINRPELPTSLSPGQTLTIDVKYSPTTEEENKKIVQISSNDADNPNREAILSGRGVILNPAVAGVFYGGTGYPEIGDILEINPATGQGTLIGKSGIFPDGLSSGEITGLAINSKGEIYCSIYAGKNIYGVDANSGAAVLLASTPLELTALAFGPNDVLYAAANGSSHLYTVDVLTGEINDLGDTGLFFNGMAFDPATGSLWVSTWADNIYKIDITSRGRIPETVLSVTEIRNSTIGRFLPGLQFDAQANLFGVKGLQETSDFVSVSKVHGRSSTIGITGFLSVYGLASKLDTFWNVNLQKATASDKFIDPVDSVRILAFISNPEKHELAVKAILQGPSFTYSDTLHLSYYETQKEGTIETSVFGAWARPIKGQSYLNVSVNAYPTAAGHLNNYLFDAAQFTAAGPVAFHDYTILSLDTIPNPGDRLIALIDLKNESFTDTVINISASISSLDTCSVTSSTIRMGFGDILPQKSATSSSAIQLIFSNNCSGMLDVPFEIKVYSDNFLFWQDTFTVFVDGTSALADARNDIPLNYDLRQNYPNPFNPTTEIAYVLPVAGRVKLSVFNAVGQKVETLVDGNIPPGKHAVRFDASGLASGVYYYRIQAKGFVQTRKMLLLR